ncbi:MAG: potassium channel family protein [Deltaproteobacteria bacterium]|nr:potassium channel family protein [Deltaproteobacteria bacterium]
MLGSLLERYRRRRFAWLFGALLATLGAQPVLETFGSDGNVFELLVGVSLCVAALGLAREPGMRWLVAAAAALVAVQGIQAVLGAAPAQTAGALLWPAGFALAATASVRHAFASGRVDGERIFAALDAYLLVAILFGVGYRAIDRWRPGSFAGDVGADGLGLQDAVYLSFVTIASLGYGDLVPKSAAARGLVIVEAVGGQMYIAVLLARLVSLYAREREPRA